MKTIINPAYEGMRDFIESLPGRFDKEGTLIHDGRNKIRVFDVDGVQLNVKRYHRPAPLNRFVYSFLRKPKGLRAYEYPARLAAAGIETPEPVAYIEEREGRMITDSYFVSIQCPYGNAMYGFGNADPESCREFIGAFARFIAKAHEAGILHLDLSPGNVLYRHDADGWHFSLIDINRMRFGKVDVPTGCANFARLWGQPGFFRILGEEYAAVRHADTGECVRMVTEARNRFWRRFVRRHEAAYNLSFE